MTSSSISIEKQKKTKKKQKKRSLLILFVHALEILVRTSFVIGMISPMSLGGRISGCGWPHNYDVICVKHHIHTFFIFIRVHLAFSYSREHILGSSVEMVHAICFHKYLLWRVAFYINDTCRNGQPYCLSSESVLVLVVRSKRLSLCVSLTWCITIGRCEWWHEHRDTQNSNQLFIDDWCFSTHVILHVNYEVHSCRKVDKGAWWVRLPFFMSSKTCPGLEG